MTIPGAVVHYRLSYWHSHAGIGTSILGPRLGLDHVLHLLSGLSLDHLHDTVVIGSAVVCTEDETI